MTRNCTAVSGRRKTRGFSLVELMIALVIGLIMMTGLIQIFLANRQSYRVMEGANFMQENMRFAVDRIAQSVRMADHWGSVNRRRVTGGTTGASECTAAWARDLTRAMTGSDGGSTVPTAYANCIPAANYQPNTDIILVRYAGSDVLPDLAALTPTQWYVQASSSASQANIFRVTPPTLNTEAAKQVYLLAYNAELFWVRRCSDPGADNNCGTSDDGDTPIPIPTLMRSYLDSAGAWVSEPMAEGIEQLQIEYQVMNRQWRNATLIEALGAVSGLSAWDTVTGVRIAGLMRSAQRDNGFPADTRTYTLSTDTPAYTPPAAAQKFLHMPFEANAVIRARVRPAPPI